MTKNIPGVLASLLVMLAGFWLADQIGHAILAAQGLSGSSPVSGVPVAIVLGLWTLMLEAAQTWLPGRVADVTPAILPAFWWLVVRALGTAARGR